MFAFDITRDQRIFELHGYRPRDPSLCWDRCGLHRRPSRHIGEAIIADFASAYEIAERPDDLLNRSNTVPNVHPVQIDIVGTKALE